MPDGRAIGVVFGIAVVVVVVLVVIAFVAVAAADFDAIYSVCCCHYCRLFNSRELISSLATEIEIMIL